VETGWLLREGDVLAALEARRSGWTRTIQGVVIVNSPALVHTLGCERGLDVAWCSPVTTEAGGPGFEVRRIAGLAPRRLARPQLTSGAIVAAGPGAFERWRLQVGDRLEVRDS
jgi:hypothetical protein